MADAQTLQCPKCRGQMRTYERNGVVVDQCEDCRGIFLDRGELEQLLGADAPGGRGDDSSESRDFSHREKGDSRRHKRSSPASLLSDLLGGGE